MMKVMVECPDCPSASDAHAMNVDLLFKLAAAVLPYVVCVAVVLLIMKLGATRGKGSGKGHVTAGHGGGAAAGGNTRLTTAGLFLGIGLGGFINDIVLQQILQLHQILS